MSRSATYQRVFRPTIHGTAFRPGPPLRIAIRWICTWADFRPVLHPSCFGKKFRCRPLAGSNPSTRGRVPRAVAIRFAIGRRGASLPQYGMEGSSQNRMVVIVTAGGGPEASGRMRQALGSEAAAGEETASAFFGTGRVVATEADVCAGTSSTRSRSVRVCPRSRLGEREMIARSGDPGSSPHPQMGADAGSRLEPASRIVR